MAEIFRRKWWALFLPLFAIAALMAALIPGSASAALGTGTITGTITDASGNALDGITVDVYNAADDELYSGSTDSNGLYSITDVADGTYYIYLNPDGAANANGVEYSAEWYGATPGAENSQDEPSASAVTVTTGGTSTVSDDLALGAAVTGKVTDATTGDGLGDGYVDLIDASGDDVGSTYLSDDGTYTVGGLPSGTYYLYLQGYDNAAVNNEYYDFSEDSAVNDPTAYVGTSGLLSTWQDGSGFTLTSGSATPTTENVALPTATSVSGTVTTGGNPEGDTFVGLYDSAGNPVDEYSTYTDDSTTDAGYGTYTINNVLPGTYKVGFEPSYYNSNQAGNLAFQFYNNSSTLSGATTISPTAAMPATGINASLVTGGEITGTITDASTGKPVPGAYAELLDANGDYLAETEDNEDGTYTLDGIPTGTFYVEFYADGENYETYQEQYDGDSVTLGSATPISVTAGSTTSGINAALKAANAPTPVNTVTTTTTTTVAAAIPTISGSKPTISGTAKVAYTLRAKTGTWTTGTSFRYQWLAGGKAIVGATGSTLKLAAADYRKVITLTVVGAESGFYSTAEASAATKAVVAGTNAAKVPTITGTKKVGDKLTAKTGIWTAGTKFTYRWYANNKAIKGATKSTFKLASAEKGKKITVKVTGKLTGYTTVTKTSKATAKIAG